MCSEVVQSWIHELWDRQGTDLLITVGTPPRIRVDGDLRSIEGVEPLTPDDTEAIALEIVGPNLRSRLEERKDVDFSFNWGGVARFRGNAFRQRGSHAVALRMIPLAIPRPDELGIPAVVQDFVRLPVGLVLVTGPTGAGKSTTLASMIDWINEHRSCHILTIEDPIEYVHHHKRSAVNQREIGDDSDSFQDALRSALREDPDVLLLGEMRDPESIATALTIAETGHLVLAPLHTNDTSQAVDRIVDVFPADRRDQIQVQLASTLAGIISQRLVPRIDGGLVAAYEVMVANQAVRNLVREGKSRQLRNVVATHQQEGMQTLEAHLNELIANGTIDHEAALGVTLYPREIDQPLLPGSELQVVAAPAASNGAGGSRLLRRS